MREKLFKPVQITPDNSFLAGIEGPACDRYGNLYAVKYQRKNTIGKVTPEGECSVFLELAGTSKANGIRFNREGYMFIADHVNHNIFKVDMNTYKISVYAHEPSMNQPNDLAITKDGVLYASDPSWKKKTGQLWKIDTYGTVTLLESDMGTTNGIEVSANEKTLYVNESAQKKIWAYEILEDKNVANKRLLIEFEDFGLDGMRCDTAGNLYVTRCHKGTVAKISPSGEVLHEIEVGGRKCTNVAFGGPDGRSCYVTIADKGAVEMFRTDIPGRSWKLFSI